MNFKYLSLMACILVSTVSFADTDPYRDFKCAADLDVENSAKIDRAALDGFEEHLGVITSVRDGKIQLFRLSPQVDLIKDIPQSFQILGSAQKKRVVATSTGKTNISFFITTKTGGYGFIEVIKREGEGEVWELIYDLVCS